ncbi:MAG: succinylglutamate desuccinylase/aspartoacylase family protein [Nitrososphaeria archaeon]
MSGFLRIGATPVRPVELPLTIINGKNDGSLVVITAGIHGTEYVGIATALDLIKSLNPANISGALIIVPVVNILGFEQRSKCTVPIEDDYNGTRNLGRLFPGRVDGTLPHILAHILFNQIISKANFLIDLHGGDIYEYIAPCTMVYTTDNKDLDQKMLDAAKFSGIEYCICRSFRGQEGKLSVEALKIGIPSITIESGDHGVIDESKVNLALNAVMNILRYLKVLDGEIKQYRPPKMLKDLVVVRARNGGLLRTLIPLGSTVSKSEKIGYIQGWSGEIVEYLEAPVSGYLIQWSCNPSVTSGESVAEIAIFY